MSAILKTVTVTFTETQITFPAGFVGPTSIGSANLILGQTVISGVISGLTAVFSSVPLGDYTLQATTIDGNGNPVPTADINGNPVQPQLTGAVNVTSPGVVANVATGFTYTVA